MTVKKVILDCDPGHDDAIAILLALGNKSIDLLAITTVSGNATIEHTTDNALKVVEIANRPDVPVYKGSPEPLVRKRENAPSIHGESGMEGPVLAATKIKAQEEHAVDYLVKTFLHSDGDITLVATGPLTNVAMAIKREPNILPKIKELVIMGGGTFGNWTPNAEFNIYADAEAAKIVFDSGLKLTMVGLDLSHQALATDEIVEQVKQINNPVSQFVYELLLFFGKTYKDYFDFEYPPVHDVCCIAYCINPEVFETTFVHVDVEIAGAITYGTTSVDLHGVTGKEPNTHFATKLDTNVFWLMVSDALKSYGGKE